MQYYNTQLRKQIQAFVKNAVGIILIGFIVIIVFALMA